MLDHVKWPVEVRDSYQDAAQQAPEDRSFFARCVKWLGDEVAALEQQLASKEAELARLRSFLDEYIQRTDNHGILRCNSCMAMTGSTVDPTYGSKPHAPDCLFMKALALRAALAETPAPMSEATQPNGLLEVLRECEGAIEDLLNPASVPHDEAVRHAHKAHTMLQSVLPMSEAEKQAQRIIRRAQAMTPELKRELDAATCEGCKRGATTYIATGQTGDYGEDLEVLCHNGRFGACTSKAAELEPIIEYFLRQRIAELERAIQAKQETLEKERK